MSLCGREKGGIQGMPSVIQKQLEQERVNNLLGFLQVCKSIDYKDKKSVRDFYFYCLQEYSSYGCHKGKDRYTFKYAMDCFKKWFPKEYSYFNSVLNKRTLMKRDIEFMQWLSNDCVEFGDLTFDNELDARTEENKRKKALRFMNKFFDVFFIVEEYGEEHGRYHIHFCGVLKKGVTYLEFHNSWSSYCWIRKVKSVKKASKYLCDYIVKQVPRIRRSSMLSKGINLYKKCKDNVGLRDCKEACELLDLVKDVIVVPDLPF